jgi:hypothetical protein
MREVDVVRERDDGTIVGIEVKAGATVKAGDFGGLLALAEACGDQFAFGVVLYDGTDVVPFGDRLAAAPLSCLWMHCQWEAGWQRTSIQNGYLPKDVLTLSWQPIGESSRHGNCGMKKVFGGEAGNEGI